VVQRYGHLSPGASRQAALDLDLYLEAASLGHRWGGDGSAADPSEKSLGIEMERTGIEPLTSGLQKPLQAVAGSCG